MVEQEEQFFPTSAARLQRALPWLRVGNLFRLAFSLRSMVCAMGALLLWCAGDQYLTPPSVTVPPPIPWPISAEIEPRLIEHAAQAAPAPLPLPWENTLLPPTPATRSPVQLSRFWSAPGAMLQESLSNGRAVLWPGARMFALTRSAVSLDDKYSHLLTRIIRWLWGLAICTVFGLAIARRAAFELAGESAPNLRRMLAYSWRRAISAVGAPVTAMIGLTLLAGITVAAGWVLLWISRFVPAVGPALGGAFWVATLTLGGILSVVALVIVASWPLMIAAVAVDGSDAFDALSRGVSYVLNRPWQALFFVLVTLLYGSMTLYFLSGATRWGLDCGLELALFGATEDVRSAVLHHLPQHPLIPTEPVSVVHRGAAPQIPPLAGQLIGGWVRFACAIPAAYVFSYFWSAVAFLYILLRRSEDAAPLNQVAPDRPPARPPYPLVGVPAAEEREARLRDAASPPQTPDSNPSPTEPS